MPQITASDVNLSSSVIKARPSGDSKAARNEDKSFKGQVSNEEEKKLSENDGRRDVLKDIRTEDCLKLPTLTKATRYNNSVKSKFEVLLQRRQCSDLTIHQLTSDWCGKHRENLSSSCLRNHEVSPGMQKRIPIVSDENGENNSEEGNARQSLKEKSLDSKLPLSCSILEGQRVNLREKARLNKQRKQIRKHSELPHAEKGNKLPNQSDTSSKDPDHIKTFLMKSMLTRRNTSDTVSVNTGKRSDRPVFHLPKADKYDISPRGLIDNQVCSVFRVNDVKSSSLFYPSFNNAWSPNRDNYRIKHSVFKAFAQQPAVFIREPSPVAGVKIHLKEHEDSFTEAIQAVEKTNALTSAVDTAVTRQVKKFVVRLPPIC